MSGRERLVRASSAGCSHVPTTCPPVQLVRVRRRESSSRIVRPLAPLMSPTPLRETICNFVTEPRSRAPGGWHRITCPDESARSCRARPGDALPGRDLDRSQTGVPARALTAAASDASAQTVVQLRTGVAGVQHVQEMVRRTLPAGATRSSIDWPSNRLAKIAEAQSAGPN